MYYVIEADESSALEGDAPTSDQINSAFRGVPLPAGAQWVGPRARVTRVTNVGSPTAGFVTRAARMLQVDAPLDPNHSLDDTATYVGDQVDFALAFQSPDWSRAVVTPWAAAVNGDVSWWQDGSAAVTQTENEFPTLAGRLDAAENPIGPTTSATHPGTIPQALSGASGSIALLAALALGIGVLWTFGSAIRSSLPTARPRPARPSRRSPNRRRAA